MQRCTLDSDWLRRTFFPASVDVASRWRLAVFSVHAVRRVDGADARAGAADRIAGQQQRCPRLASTE